MKRFVVPPSWPTPPRRSWVPPKTWSPDPAWPAAPDDWKFWVDGKGNPVRGPVGRYGGPSRRAAFAGAGGLVLFLVVNFWALSAIGLFDGDPAEDHALPVVDDTSATPSATPTPKLPPRTTAVPSAPPPVQKTTVKPTPKPSPQPTRTKTTTQTEKRPDPTPTRTTVTRTPRPPRTTPSRPPTREEIIAQYCASRGWNFEWCDPDNWPDDPNRR